MSKRSRTPIGSVARCAALLLATVGLAGLVAACSSSGGAPSVAAPQVPSQPDQTTPEAAVRSYLDWVSFSYRMANSDIGTQTMTPYEGVRIDSYIELNRQKGVGLEQSLVSFTPGQATVEGTGAVLPAREEWRYRYFSLKTLRYTSAEATASYDATYTLLNEGGLWLVDQVEATALTPVK